MRRQVAPVRSDSGRTIGQQHGDALDHGIAPAASGAAQGVGVQRQGLTADRTGEPAKVFGSERHKNKVLGARFEVRGSRKCNYRDSDSSSQNDDGRGMLFESE